MACEMLPLYQWVCSVMILGLVLGIDQMWTHKVDVIRIQNNGSQIRTIFLPKLSSTSNIDIVGGSGRNSTHLVFNSNWLPDGPKNHSVSYIDNEVRTGAKQNILGKSEKDFYTKFTKPFKKMQDGNFSTNSILYNWKQDPSGNRSFTPAIQFNVGANKIAKLLNLFTIVNFTNNDCYSSDGLVGTCYHALECKAIEGQPLGTCAQGYGVCCYVEKSCGESSRINNTHMTVAGIDREPQTGVYICTVTINKISPHVRQLRITFEHFQLAGPVNGNCVIDRFVVTGQNRNDIIPPICGFNTGKHIYVDVDETAGPVSLTLLSSGAYGIPKKFKVRVTQLKKDSPLLAPNNCLQFYTEPQDSVESFNYSPFNSTTNVAPGYFNNLNYAICFKKTNNFCGIVYSNVAAGGMEFDFEIVNKEADGTYTVPEGQAGAERFDCPDDYIVISGTRLCGYKFNDGSVLVDFSKNYPVTDNTNGPLVLQFHTNNNATGRGFHLEYQLSKCSLPSPPLPPATTTTTTPTGLPPPAATRRIYVPVDLIDS